MTDLPRSDSQSATDVSHQLHALRARWGWFLVIGLVLFVLGCVAAIHVLSATLASVLFVGILMIMAGIGQLIQAWRVKDWRGFLLWTFSGVLYTGAGVLAILNPIGGASVLTLLLGAFLIGAGAFRLWVWFQNRSQAGWKWIAASGALSVLAGLLIAAGWPDNSLWILGILLAIDLIWQGWMMVFLGLALKQSSGPAR